MEFFKTTFLVAKMIPYSMYYMSQKFIYIISILKYVISYEGR